jgi:methylmalonyl-CoA/ethylmalonyl-CoA epimerase
MPNDVAIRVDHVGIAVRSIRDAEPFLELLGCTKFLEETVEDRFRWAYYRLGEASRLELIEPVSSDSFLTAFLDEHGPGLHHVTLEVSDIDRVLERLEANDVRTVDYRAFDDWSEVFVSPRNPTGVLFQLMEYHESFDDDRPSDLYVGGQRLGDRDA